MKFVNLSDEQLTTLRRNLQRRENERNRKEAIKAARDEKEVKRWADEPVTAKAIAAALRIAQNH